MIRRLAPLVLVLATGGCFPWVMGETAETLDRGALRADVAATALGPLTEVALPLPVPQLRVAAGFRDGWDAALSYVPLLTVHGRLRSRVHMGEDWAAAVALGAGIHGIPDLTNSGARLAVPFGTAALQVSSRGGPRRWYGSLRTIVPAHFGDAAAFTLWVTPQVGVQVGSGAVRYGFETGLVVPTQRPAETQVMIGVSAGWARRAPTP